MSQEFYPCPRTITKPTRYWRAASGLGAIHGLPTSRGYLVATDGVLCTIVRDDGSVFEGHLDNFEREKQTVSSGRKLSTKKTHAKRETVGLEAFE